jgi:hypothetical protein
METLYSRCCGLDVHKSSITACVLLEQSPKRGKHIRRFGCTTREMRELVSWLRELRIAVPLPQPSPSTAHSSRNPASISPKKRLPRAMSRLPFDGM